jgi:GT2 family glycosyltransferase
MQSDHPLITFLISTFNRRDVLLRTLGELRSASRVSGIRTETIVVDNASSDGTANAVSTDFPEVNLIRGRVNRGACAKNDGLAIARGTFVVTLDDDSFPTADSLGRMASHFAADPELGAAVFDVTLPDGSHECSAYPSVFIGCGTGFRREALIQAGGFPDDFFMQAEEYDLSLRLIDAGWKIERFSDLQVQHLKTPGARIPARTTRLDVRNNLTLIARRFPRKWILPYTMDWMRRYRWIAGEKGTQHRRAFWRGLAEGVCRSLRTSNRKAVSAGTFEEFAQLDQVLRRMQRVVWESGAKQILLIDVGKNIYAYWKAAKTIGVCIVAIADPRLAKSGRKYRGVAIVDDAAAKELAFDLAIVANSSPVHAAKRLEQWQATEERQVIDLFKMTPDFGEIAKAA